MNKENKLNGEKQRKESVGLASADISWEMSK